jgi:alpha-1,6-mannosyltransferase
MTAPPRSGQTSSTWRAPNSARQVLLVAAIGALSAILYGVVYRTQQAIFRNGLGLGFGDLLPGGLPADRAQLRLQMAGYYGAMLSLIALYLGLLAGCRRGYLASKPARLIALGFPVLFNLALLFGRPYLSIDLFSYLAHGYLGGQPGGNPYLQAAAEAGETPFGAQLIEYGWIPVHPQSPYGPLSYHWRWECSPNMSR